MKQVGFGGGTDVRGDVKAEFLTAGTARHDANRSAPRDAVSDAVEGKFLAAVELQGVDAVLVREQERDHAHADQVGTVNALERACDHGAHAEQGGPFGRPVATAASAEIAPAENDERNIALAVAHGGVGNRDRLAFGIDLRPPPLAAVGHAIADAYVAVGATHHDMMVSAPADIAVEGCGLYANRLKILSRGT